MKIFTPIFFVFLSIFLFYPLQTFSSQVSTETGRLVFAKHCWFCHGQRGDGNSDAAAVLKPKPKNFTDPEVIRKLTFDRMITSITNGRKGTAMPSFKETLLLSEIKSVTKYIRDIIMKGKKTEMAYEPHVEGFSYISFESIGENSDLKICLLQCHTDETFIRKRLKDKKK